MNTVEVYTFETKEGVEDTFYTFDPQEAREYAQANHRKWIANIFKFADSELVADYCQEEESEDV